MSSKPVTYCIITLVSIYTLLVFAVIAINDIMENDESSYKPLRVMLWIELVILIMFGIEIIVSAYG